MSENEYPSPFDRFPGDFIESSVVDDSGEEIRVLGYALGSDLATHYDTAEILLSLFCGELPDTEAGQAFSKALTFAMPLSIADASVHAARVARHLATIANNDATVVSAAAVAVSEHSRYEIERLSSFLAWLDDGFVGPLPEAARAVSPQDAGPVATLRGLVAPRFAPEAVFDAAPSRLAAAVAVLHACGVRTAHHLITALTTIRLPLAMAEAYSVSDPRVWSYPLNLPQWDYDPERR